MPRFVLAKSVAPPLPGFSVIELKARRANPVSFAAAATATLLHVPGAPVALRCGSWSNIVAMNQPVEFWNIFAAPTFPAQIPGSIRDHAPLLRRLKPPPGLNIE